MVKNVFFVTLNFEADVHTLRTRTSSQDSSLDHSLFLVFFFIVKFTLHKYIETEKIFILSFGNLPL